MDFPSPYIVSEPLRIASVAFNDALFVVLFSLLLVVFLTWRFREERMLPYIASAVLLALLLGFFFKSFLQSPRPCLLVPGLIPCPTDFSLPSMHSLLAFTLAVVSLGNRAFPIYLVYASFLAYSRLFLGVHTILEVCAGLSLAFFACVLCELLWKAVRLKIPRAIHIQHDSGRLR